MIHRAVRKFGLARPRRSSTVGRRADSKARPSGTATWQTCVGGKALHEPPAQSSFLRWLGRTIAIHHCKGMAADEHEQGRFDNIQGDLVQAAPQILNYLQEAIRSESSASELSPLRSVAIEDSLGSRLLNMLAEFRSDNAQWRWAMEAAGAARVERVFIMMGASRSGSLQREVSDLLGVFGQQFVMARDQTKRFLEPGSGSFRERMSVLQELMFKDLILVADVIVPTTQRCLLYSTADLVHGTPRGALVRTHSLQNESMNDRLGRVHRSQNDRVIVNFGEEVGCRAVLPNRLNLEAEHKQASFAAVDEAFVEHRLRLELALRQDRSYDADGFPVFRTAPWQLVDWNGVLAGNHPALPSGVPAPW